MSHLTRKRFLLGLFICLLVALNVALASFVLSHLDRPTPSVQLPTLYVPATATPSSAPPTSIALSASATPLPLDPPSATPRPSATASPLPPTATPETRATATPSTTPATADPIEIELPTEPVANRLVVSFNSAQARQAYLDSLAEISPDIKLNLVEGLQAVVLDLPAGVTADTLPPAPAAIIEPDYYVSALQGGFSDPLYSQQWALSATGVSQALAGFPENAEAVTIAVIDSGVCLDHPDLEGRLLAGYDFIERDSTPQDTFGHGCAVTGVIAANANAQGIVGIAPNAQILPLRVLNGQGLGTYSAVAEAIVYAADNGADLINLSLGGVNNSAVLTNAIDYALARDVLVIAAAGNNGGAVLFPARYAPVIAVGAVDRNLERSAFSSFGPEIDLLAPGRDILSTDLNGGYSLKTGTSFAAPIVAGIAALERAFGRELTLGGGLVSLGAQVAQVPTPTPPPASPTPAPQVGQTLTLTGYLSLIHYHGEPSNPAYGEKVFLTDSNGLEIAELQIDPATVRGMGGDQVQVTGVIQPQAQGISTPLLQVSALEPQIENLSYDAEGLVTGAQPFVAVLCKFADVATETQPASWYNNLFSNSFLGMNNYWQTISLGALNINGSTVVTRWYTLPRNRSYYIPTGGSANLSALATDCAAAANADIYYPSYTGVHFFFNSSLDCCAWGGGRTLSLDGVTKYYATTWLPPWAHEPGTLAHEMGHAFGLPHSTGPAHSPPTNMSIYVSQWDVMSAAGGTNRGFCSGPSTTCGAQGTIAYHLQKGGWLPASRVVNVGRGASTTVTLDRLTNPSSSTSFLMVKIPFPGSTTRFYTVEVRQKTGTGFYDQWIPASAVVIHDVETNTSLRYGNGGQAYVVSNNEASPNGAGSQWVVGETFTDSVNRISVRVISTSGTTYTVEVSNDAVPILSSPANTSSTNNDRPTLSWLQFPTASSYQVQISTSSTFATPLIDTSGLTSPFYAPPSALSDGLYYWRIRANVGSLFSTWSSAWTFTVDTLPPSVPVLSLPADASTITSTPTFSWLPSTGATTYEISYGRTNPPVSAYASTLTSFTPSAPLRLGANFWRVRARDAAGNWSAWSAVRLLEVTSPPNAAPIRNYFTTLTPTLSWGGLSWALGYQVQIDNLNTFTSLEYNNTFSSSTFSVAVPNGVLSDGLWYWRVRAQRPDGTWGNWSATESFIIES